MGKKELVRTSLCSLVYSNLSIFSLLFPREIMFTFCCKKKGSFGFFLFFFKKFFVCLFSKYLGVAYITNIIVAHGELFFYLSKRRKFFGIRGKKKKMHIHAHKNAYTHHCE